ncbi:hypothetical protein GOODEAATRI_002920 [Goodea atripinnis]|uniref:Uncharacterized protein n=1 Tax=Goodea atripinnis TaxID=208336 RepID=A0ABV0NSY6_9TELE
MQETLEELKAFITEKESNIVQDSTSQTSTYEHNKSQDAALSETVEDPPRKRAKLVPTQTVQSEPGSAAVVTLRNVESHVCVACLGILQDLCGPDQAVKSWTVKGLVCSYREKGLVLDKDDVIQVKEAFKAEYFLL